MQTSEELELLKKSIRYKAEHRGSKEADALIGKFCAFFMPSASPHELQLLRDLVELDDEEVLHRLEHPSKAYKFIAQTYHAFKSNPGGIL